MKLSISNIAWDNENNEIIYDYLQKKGFCGLEIAPTKLFPVSPYSHTSEAVEYFSNVKSEYGLKVASMQSIWYGQIGNIFAREEDRARLKDYTFQAIDFASAIGCRNLVFGNPKARNNPDNKSESEVFDFFKEISDYASQKETCISLEPNPVIYGTNFINDTLQAFAFCRESGCSNLRVNVDLGTVIYNDEPFGVIRNNIELVNHIHISEPYLEKIRKREIHHRLKDLDYDKYFSIEMGQPNKLSEVFEIIDYVAEVLGK